MDGTFRNGRAVVGVALALAAIAWVGFDISLGLDADDSENLETTRVLAAARQWTEGPHTLYGPYSASNPAVLIQAPLYYRLTGLAAFPCILIGFDPVTSCFAAGRMISFASFLVILFLTYRLARLCGAPSRAGWWAALLVAGSPLVGSFPVAMRPDLFAIAFQTAGLLLIAQILFERGRRDRARLVLAFLFFGLAFVTKQHVIVGPVAAVLGLAFFRPDLLRLPMLAAVGAFGLLVIAYLGCEQAITRGAMGRSVFVLPGDLKRVTAGSWAYVGVVLVETLKRGLGLLALGLAMVWAGRGRVARGAYAWWLLMAIGLELALMVQLCRNSSGGWFNYALPALVGGATLVGHGLAEIELVRPGKRWAAVAAAGLVLVLVDARLVVKGVMQRREVKVEQERLRDDARVAAVPIGSRYFSGTYQHYNRIMGRTELTHDEWLYRAFEAIDAAEPRENWLRSALEDGPVKLVVTGDEAGPRVAGLAEPLTALGFEDEGRVGRFTLWRRR
jgi:hypothetical protein